jgi:hypothetical protein
MRETESGSSIGVLFEKEKGRPVLREFLKENGSVTYNASSHRTWRASSYFGQAGNDPR